MLGCLQKLGGKQKKKHHVYGTSWIDSGGNVGKLYILLRVQILSLEIIYPTKGSDFVTQKNIYPTKGSDFVTENKNTGPHSSIGSVETNKNRYVSWTKGDDFYSDETNGNIPPCNICARIRDCEEFVVTVIEGNRHFL
jgi:hypothetical protein